MMHNKRSIIYISEKHNLGPSKTTNLIKTGFSPPNWRQNEKLAFSLISSLTAPLTPKNEERLVGAGLVGPERIGKGEGKRLRIMKEAEGKEKESRVFFYS